MIEHVYWKIINTSLVFLTGALLGVLLLILFIAIINSKNPETPEYNPCIPNAKTLACQVLVFSNCETDTNGIIFDGVHKPQCKFDVNNDGAFDEKDNLQELCESYYNVDKGNQTACKELCSCS